MAKNIYVSGAEHGSGKSVIVLAIMEFLSSRSANVGFFRPVAYGEQDDDPLIDLIVSRYRLSDAPDALYGCTRKIARELVTKDRYNELLKRIIDKYKAVERHYDIVLCAGTDFKSPGVVLEFDFNTDVANNLGCFMIPVVRGHGRTAQETIDATTTFHKLLSERDCDILATIVNRVDPKQTEPLKEVLTSTSAQPIFIVPNTPSLEKPTPGDIARALNARTLYASPDTLNREVLNYKVAAMELRDFLKHLDEGSFVITPGDRSDIILGTLAAYTSTAFPQVSGLLLTGDLEPAQTVQNLIKGLGTPPFAVLGVATDTFETAMNVNAVSGELTAENERRIAAALGAVEQSVDLFALEQRIAATRSTRITPLMFEHELIQRAKQSKQHIVLPEGEEERILRAAEILTLRDVCHLTLLGDEAKIQTKIKSLGLQLGNVNIINPQTSPWRKCFADTYFELRRHKGISTDFAFDTLADVSYFGTLMVYHDEADGMVSGATHTTQHTIRPAFETIRTAPGESIVSSVFFMCLDDRVLVYGDCAINPDPSAEQLAAIAISSAQTASRFGVTPRIAMLSYSTGESGKGADVDKVRKATHLALEQRPDLIVEGPIQYDAAVDADVAKTKLPDSDVAGCATVFIFPDLNTGNNTYKAVQRTAHAVAVGPVLQGLKKPVNDLSRGCTVTDIVNTVAITAIQAQTDRAGD